MANKAYETFRVGPFKVQIFNDQDPTSPEDWDSETLKIVTTRNRYFELNPRELPDKDELKSLSKTHWVFPLFMYAHSGVALSLGRHYPFDCPWDSGQVGFVLVAKPHANKDAAKSWRLRKNAFDAAAIYLETWNQYLSGDVWGYVITARAGDLDQDLDNEDSNEERDIDSCWGFYGLEYCKKEARELAESHAKAETEENAKIAAMTHV